MVAPRRAKDIARTYRNEIDRMVVESGLTNTQVAKLCGVSYNRIVALRRSNTFEPELIETTRKALGLPLNISQDYSMLASLGITELVDEIILNLIKRLSSQAATGSANDATRSEG